jgi:CubicO group peptidase (beta-lactamase class C family)
MTIERQVPPTAAALGLMEGSPPAAEATVTLANWWHAPFNRWSLQHAEEIMPTAHIAHGSTVRVLPAADPSAELGALTFEVDGEGWTVDEMLDATHTDGFMVLHRGTVMMQRYANGLTPRKRHILFSVTKSVVATLAGILVGRGALDPGDTVGTVIPELSETSWGDATVQHVLDMRTGTRFDEDYEDNEADMAAYTVASGMGPRTDATQPTDIYSYLAGLENDRAHGGAFDYRSPVTSMLGWICEQAGGASLATLIAGDLWGPMGAEHDASITLDANGAAMAAGGMSVTLGDLARFGQLWLEHGRGPQGDTVVPEAWIADTMAGGPDSREAFAASQDVAILEVAGWFYRNKWWVMDADAPWYSGMGINGQYLSVHEPSGVVIAKLSSQPVADDPEVERLELQASRAIAEALAFNG